MIEPWVGITVLVLYLLATPLYYPLWHCSTHRNMDDLRFLHFLGHAAGAGFVAHEWMFAKMLTNPGTYVVQCAAWVAIYGAICRKIWVVMKHSQIYDSFWARLSFAIVMFGLVLCGVLTVTFAAMGDGEKVANAAYGYVVVGFGAAIFLTVCVWRGSSAVDSQREVFNRHTKGALFTDIVVSFLLAAYTLLKRQLAGAGNKKQALTDDAIIAALFLETTLFSTQFALHVFVTWEQNKEMNIRLMMFGALQRDDGTGGGAIPSGQLEPFLGRLRASNLGPLDDDPINDIGAAAAAAAGDYVVTDSEARTDMRREFVRMRRPFVSGIARRAGFDELRDILFKECAGGDKNKARSIVEARDQMNRGWTLIHHAAAKRAVDALRVIWELYKEGSDRIAFSVVDGIGLTPLHLAILGCPSAPGLLIGAAASPSSSTIPAAAGGGTGVAAAADPGSVAVNHFASSGTETSNNHNNNHNNNINLNNNNVSALNNGSGSGSGGGVASFFSSGAILTEINAACATIHFLCHTAKVDVSVVAGRGDGRSALHLAIMRNTHVNIVRELVVRGGANSVSLAERYTVMTSSSSGTSSAAFSPPSSSPPPLDHLPTNPWFHHFVNQLDYNNKSALILAIENNNWPVVSVMLTQHTTNMCAPTGRHGQPLANNFRSSPAQLRCGKCRNAPLLHIAMVAGASSVVRGMLRGAAEFADIMSVGDGVGCVIGGGQAGGGGGGGCATGGGSIGTGGLSHPNFALMNNSTTSSSGTSPQPQQLLHHHHHGCVAPPSSLVAGMFQPQAALPPLAPNSPNTLSPSGLQSQNPLQQQQFPSVPLDSSGGCSTPQFERAMITDRGPGASPQTIAARGGSDNQNNNNSSSSSSNNNNNNQNNTTSLVDLHMHATTSSSSASGGGGGGAGSASPGLASTINSNATPNCGSTSAPAPASAAMMRMIQLPQRPVSAPYPIWAKTIFATVTGSTWAAKGCKGLNVFHCAAMGDLCPTVLVELLRCVAPPTASPQENALHDALSKIPLWVQLTARAGAVNRVAGDGVPCEAWAGMWVQRSQRLEMSKCSKHLIDITRTSIDYLKVHAPKLVAKIGAAALSRGAADEIVDAAEKFKAAELAQFVALWRASDGQPEGRPASAADIVLWSAMHQQYRHQQGLIGEQQLANTKLGSSVGGGADWFSSSTRDGSGQASGTASNNVSVPHLGAVAPSNTPQHSSIAARGNVTSVSTAAASAALPPTTTTTTTRNIHDNHGKKRSPSAPAPEDNYFPGTPSSSSAAATAAAMTPEKRRAMEQFSRVLSITNSLDLIVGAKIGQVAPASSPTVSAGTPTIPLSGGPSFGALMNSSGPPSAGVFGRTAAAFSTSSGGAVHSLSSATAAGAGSVGGGGGGGGGSSRTTAGLISRQGSTGFDLMDMSSTGNNNNNSNNGSGGISHPEEKMFRLRNMLHVRAGYFGIRNSDVDPQFTPIEIAFHRCHFAMFIALVVLDETLSKLFPPPLDYEDSMVLANESSQRLASATMREASNLSIEPLREEIAAQVAHFCM